MGFVPTVEPVPHWYLAPVPNVPPVAVNVVELPLQILLVPVMPVGATDG